MADVTGVPPKKDEPFDDAKREKFLADFRKWGNISHACRVVRVSRPTAYRHYEGDPDFRAAWDDAKEEGVESLEHEAWRRAKAQSDTLLIFLLKAHKPDRYRETTNQNINLSGNPAQPIVTEVVIRLPNDDTMDTRGGQTNS